VAAASRWLLVDGVGEADTTAALPRTVVAVGLAAARPAAAAVGLGSMTGRGLAGQWGGGGASPARRAARSRRPGGRPRWPTPAAPIGAALVGLCGPPDLQQGRTGALAQPHRARKSPTKTLQGPHRSPRG